MKTFPSLCRQSKKKVIMLWTPLSCDARWCYTKIIWNVFSCKICSSSKNSWIQVKAKTFLGIGNILWNYFDIECWKATVKSVELLSRQENMGQLRKMLCILYLIPEKWEDVDYCSVLIGACEKKKLQWNQISFKMVDYIKNFYRSIMFVNFQKVKVEIFYRILFTLFFSFSFPTWIHSLNVDRLKLLDFAAL